MTQFDNLFEELKKGRAEKTKSTSKTNNLKTAKKTAAKKEKKMEANTPAVISNQPSKVKSRTVGKSRDSKYKQVLTYLKKDTHKKVKKFLLDDVQERDLSDLVEELISDWVNQQK